MAENKVAVEITLEEKAALKALTQLTKEVQKTEDGFKKMGNQGDDSLGLIGQTASGVTTGFKSLVGGVTVANLASEAIIGTANALKGFVVDSLNAAIESEQATQKLGQSLRAVGAFSEETVADFLSYASSLAEVSVESDDAIVSQLAMAKSFGATNKQAKDLVKAALELSATFGGSLDERVMQLGKTLTGVGGKLDSLIPGFKGLTEQQLRSGEAFEFVNSKFGGASANQLETYGGKLNQLKKAFSELQESVGGFVVGSGFAESFVKSSKLINEFNKSLSDSKIESERAKGGYKETSESLKQLERKYSDLYTEAEKAKEVINNPTFFDTLLARPLAAAENLKRLQEEMAKTKAVIADATPKVEAGIANAPQGVSAPLIDPEQERKAIQTRQQTYAQLDAIRAEYNAKQIEEDVAKKEITEANYQFELERLLTAEQMKVEAVYAAEEQKALAIQDSTARQFALQKVAVDKEMALEKTQVESRKKLDMQLVQLEQRKQAAIAAASIAGLELLGTLAKDGSREQFLIMKAAALAQAAVATKVAYMQALAHPPGPPETLPIAGWVAAAGAANMAAIAATAIKGYEFGGIIPGSSTTGDRVPAMVNSGEMILNRQQQTKLFNMANGGGEGGSRIEELLERLVVATERQNPQIVVDGRVLATVIRKQVQDGFKLS